MPTPTKKPKAPKAPVVSQIKLPKKPTPPSGKPRMQNTRSGTAKWTRVKGTPVLPKELNPSTWNPAKETQAMRNDPLYYADYSDLQKNSRKPKMPKKQTGGGKKR